VPARPPVTLAGALAGGHLATLRDRETRPEPLRRAAAALGALVLGEALRDLEPAPVRVTTPLAGAEVAVPRRRVTVVPVLRAGLALLEPALAMLPDDTRVGFLGMARDEATLRPRLYLESLPPDLTGDDVVVLEVMIATGGSTLAALRALRAAGAARLHVVGLIAAPEGLAAVAEGEPEVPLTVAAIDAGLDERGFIVPGMGDAGDRLYGTGE
jgi:uracil phosphoribosyltransferase